MVAMDSPRQEDPREDPAESSQHDNWAKGQGVGGQAERIGDDDAGGETPPGGHGFGIQDPHRQGPGGPHRMVHHGGRGGQSHQSNCGSTEHPHQTWPARYQKKTSSLSELQNSGTEFRVKLKVGKL